MTDVTPAATTPAMTPVPESPQPAAPVAAMTPVAQASPTPAPPVSPVAPPVPAAPVAPAAPVVAPVSASQPLGGLLKAIATGTNTTIAGALLSIAIGLADIWYFKQLTDVDKFLIGGGIGALLGVNPLATPPA